MLNNFPTPYPDETFYSTLCRYYISTGIRKASAIRQQLFGSVKTEALLSVYPNLLLHQLMEQIPKGTFDERHLLLEHTAFRYYIRIHPAAVSSAVLADMVCGTGKMATHIWRTFPKEQYALWYCPRCVEEDTNQYGEPFYHLEHQIPLSRVCIRHECYLKKLALGESNHIRRKDFFPLSMMPVDNEADYQVRPSERIVSQIVWEYYKLPLSICPTISRNNLYDTLIRNYGGLQKKGERTETLRAMYDSLCQYHGKTVIEPVFGDGISSVLIGRIRRWECAHPDPYILIQSMLGMSTGGVFGSERREESNNISREDILKTVEVIKRMSEQEAREYLAQCGYQPVWSQAPAQQRNDRKKQIIRCGIDVDEMENIRLLANAFGYEAEEDFVLACCRSVINHIGGVQKGKP